MVRKTTLLALCLLMSCCLTKAQNILFVGNSLTYSNDMPQMLEDLAEMNGLSIQTMCLCQPNYALEDHLNEGTVLYELASKPYDFLILQQGPSSQDYGRKKLFDMGGKLAALARQNKAKTAFLMVWPAKDYYQSFDAVIENYTDASHASLTILIPLGTVWQKLNLEHPEYELYGEDGFHPSQLGSFLEALVILKSIHPKLEVTTLKTDFRTEGIKDDESMQQFLNAVSKYLKK